MWCTFLLLTFFVTVQGRAVNISNTWVLPEEGFPVFYRYFKDRISWYEADAVCQFHHANLVTVDTTAQYDAVRAYLKELDISSAVWVGLIRSNPDGDFTWTDFRGLGGDGYWSSAPDTTTAPLCAAADPTSDYRWQARACGGPTVASFICELPVPQWALGDEGCMVRALPALTIVYLPERVAVQLTADCGLAGVKRVQCKGNMTRDDLLKELSCVDEDQITTTTNNIALADLRETTMDVPFTDQDSINDSVTDELTTTEHEDNINRSMAIDSTPIFQNSIIYVPDKVTANSISNKIINEISNVESFVPEVLNNNNLYSNEILKHSEADDIISNEQREKEEDEKHLQHKKLHDELARLGNLETMFSQTTDHFVPPLVMAKAKLNDDMIALSIKEKLAQQLAVSQFFKYVNHSNSFESNTSSMANISKGNEVPSTPSDHQMNQSRLIPTPNVENNKNILKHIIPKKYSKYTDVKGNTMKKDSPKQEKIYKSTKTLSLETTTSPTIETANVTSTHTKHFGSIDLSIILKEPEQNVKEGVNSSTHKVNIKDNDDSSEIATDVNPTTQEFVMNDETIKIVIFKNDNGSHVIPTVFEVTTKVPVLKTEYTTHIDSATRNHSEKYETSTEVIQIVTEPDSSLNTKETPVSPRHEITTSITEPSIKPKIDNTMATTTEYQPVLQRAKVNSSHIKDMNETNNESQLVSINDNNNNEMNKTDWYEKMEKNDTSFDTETTPEFDDFQSPLLSGANEPIHKPPRFRRPQVGQNRAKKFSPFRILG